MEKALAVGSSLVIDGHEVVIVDIVNSQTIGGRLVTIRAMDADSAQKTQAQQIEQDQLGQSVVEMLRKMLSGGQFPGGLGNL